MCIRDRHPNALDSEVTMTDDDYWEEEQSEEQREARLQRKRTRQRERLAAETDQQRISTSRMCNLIA